MICSLSFYHAPPRAAAPLPLRQSSTGALCLSLFPPRSAEFSFCGVLVVAKQPKPGARTHIPVPAFSRAGACGGRQAGGRSTPCTDGWWRLRGRLMCDLLLPGADFLGGGMPPAGLASPPPPPSPSSTTWDSSLTPPPRCYSTPPTRGVLDATPVPGRQHAYHAACRRQHPCAPLPGAAPSRCQSLSGCNPAQHPPSPYPEDMYG